MAQSTRKKIGIDFGENDRKLKNIHAYLAKSSSSREILSDLLIAALLPPAMFPQGETSEKELWAIGYQSIDRLIAQINSIVDLYSLEGIPLPVDGLARRVSFLGQPSIPPSTQQPRSMDADANSGDGDDEDTDEDEDEEFELVKPPSSANFSLLMTK